MSIWMQTKLENQKDAPIYTCKHKIAQTIFQKHILVKQLNVLLSLPNCCISKCSLCALRLRFVSTTYSLASCLIQLKHTPLSFYTVAAKTHCMHTDAFTALTHLVNQQWEAQFNAMHKVAWPSWRQTNAKNQHRRIAKLTEALHYVCSSLIVIIIN